MSRIEFIGELPASPHPWRIAAYKDLVVLCNQDHPPMVVCDGKLIGSHPLPPFGDSVRPKDSDSTTEVK